MYEEKKFFCMCTMLVMFTDELFLGFETICCTLTELWYGQEELGYPALLIRLECCLINICAADISRKVILLQPKRYTWTDWQFYVAQILRHSHSHTSWPFIAYPFLQSFAFSCNSWRWSLLVPSAVTPVPIHADSPSTTFQRSSVEPSPTAANTL
jgi:hypothetical protein